MDSFGRSSDLRGTGSTLFSGGLFWRELKLSRNWLHIIFQQIVLGVAQIWRELAPQYFPTDCFGGSSNLEGTGSRLFSGRLFWKFGGSPFGNLEGTDSTLFSGGLFLSQLRFGGNWLHINVGQIVLEAA